MYAMMCIRPDIAHVMGVVSTYMIRPREQHWEAIKWLLRNLRGLTDTCLCFTGVSLELQGYVDADLASNIGIYFGWYNYILVFTYTKDCCFVYYSS